MDIGERGHRLYTALDAQDWDGVTALVHPDLVVRHDSLPPVGLAQWREAMAGFAAGFPDGHHVIEDAFVAGDRFVTCCRFEGTHTGPFHGVAPTGAAVAARVIHIDRFRDGRVAEHRGQLDMLGLLRQIGAIAG